MKNSSHNRKKEDQWRHRTGQRNAAILRVREELKRAEAEKEKK